MGSLLRTADGLGVDRVYLTGYTPYPLLTDDPRLPHLAAKIDGQIHKTALDAEKTVKWQQQTDIIALISQLKVDGYRVTALEQTTDSQALPQWQPAVKQAIVVGREVEGLEPDIVTLCSDAVEIPMLGTKESFNVVQAAAMALYHCRFAASLVQ